MTERQIGIVSVGQTTHESRKDLTSEEIIFEAVSNAFRGCTLDVSDIDIVADSGNDMLEGRSISDCTMIEALGGHLRPSYNIEEDGAMAAYYAKMLLQSGKYDTALVVGHGKASNLSQDQFTNMMFEPFCTRPTGIDGVTSAALQARAYVEATETEPMDAARVVARNHTRGADNAKVQTGIGSLTPEEAAAADEVATPLRESDTPPVTDGACALVLAADEVARRATDQPAWIEGAAHSSDSYTLDRDLSRARSGERAAEDAYEQAGVTDPRAEIDIAEISGPTSYQELLLYEALGLSERGESPTLLDDDETAVNPSGGTLAANPTMATGLVRIAETALQVTGTAGDRQVEGASRGLAHGTTGINLQNNAVFVIGA